MSEKEKTIIAVLASHDSEEKNKELAAVLEEYAEKRGNQDNYRFLFTGGTYDRVFGIRSEEKHQIVVTPLEGAVARFYLEGEQPRAIRLPSRTRGGVTVLACMITRRQCSIIWPYLDPRTMHWLVPENLALTRLCDYWHVKRLMNKGSVQEWIEKDVHSDSWRNRQPTPHLPLYDDDDKERFENRTMQKTKEPEYGGEIIDVCQVPDWQCGPPTDQKEEKNHEDQRKGNWIEPLALRKPIRTPEDCENLTLALIAHDEMKDRMVEFALDYEKELINFRRILTTGTTGRKVLEVAPDLNGKIVRCHSGPKGGDIEIATEILYGCCHVVIFFLDPLNPHPHIEDIRVLFGACMLRNEVRMLTNEMQAREWINRVFRSPL